MFVGGMRCLLAAGMAFLPIRIADEGDDAGASAQQLKYLIWARQKPRSGSGTTASETADPEVTCSRQRWPVNGQSDGVQSVDPASGGSHYLIECSNGFRDIAWDVSGDLISIRPDYDPRVSAEKLARRAYRQIPIPVPKLLTAPPRGRDGLVGLPHWFWLADGQWAAKSKRLRAGAVWVKATAAPQQMTINAGDGRTFTCSGPGNAYNHSLSPDQQRSTCSYLYTHPAHAYRVTVSVTWEGTWQGSGGLGGTLPPITRSVTFPVRVVEAQTLVVRE
ncbi:hypothetical protein [Spongiactinospora sp. TRM90649]|uniref:hypothetical protein n=1 Tax=Spongiactinospora sp. TRM90649 TaxID=3031114 RepID=UPI0023F735A4|nr:hypothetical protein [Spongiactinospora sp. TRM90649]MDF5758429.1 hypothetical protein [Spongiactinospora sp. TRM90649]